MTNHATIDQPRPPVAGNTVPEATSPARPQLKIFWALAGLLGSAATGVMFGRVAAAESTRTGDYCFASWYGFAFGYLGAAVTIAMVGKYITSAAGDGYRRNHYAQNGAMALPGAILLAIILLVALN